MDIERVMLTLAKAAETNGPWPTWCSSNAMLAANLRNAADEIARLRKLEAEVEPMRVSYGRLLKEVYG